MKKYNLSNIMKRAWELVKKAGMSISSGLKKAWDEAKKELKKVVFSGKAKVLQIEKGEPKLGASDSDYLYFHLWEGKKKRRIYANDYKGRSVGYIDLDNNNEIETEYSKGVNVDTLEWFVANYEF